MKLPNAPIPEEGYYVSHFIVVADQARSRRFYADILGGKVILTENPCLIKLANTWLFLNSGGGPTPDKPDILLASPASQETISSFLVLVVVDLWATYQAWLARGAEFITPPLDNRGWELRCYLKDPDGHIIEVVQFTGKMLDRLEPPEEQATSPNR